MTKLKDKQLRLLRHLAQFETLDYLSCLLVLDTEGTYDRTALSYAFRPLSKHKYIRRRRDNSVIILAKGRALFPETKPLITLGGGAEGRERANVVSRTAMFLSESGVKSFASPKEAETTCFIPSACWRKIRTGILSTTRFAGILRIGEHRLAVYGIGDGNMEWQLRAEGSLFYRSYGEYETRATGMLFICDDGRREEVAEKIIRQTMWSRKQLLGSGSEAERTRPVQYVRAPIRLKALYERVYLTTPSRLCESLAAIELESRIIAHFRRNSEEIHDPAQGDYEAWPYRYFVNTTTDLLKFVYYFAAAKFLLALRREHYSELNYALILPKHDFGTLRIYPDIVNMEGAEFYEYRPAENSSSD